MAKTNNPTKPLSKNAVRKADYRAAMTPAKSVPNKNDIGKNHTIVKGETLSSIAKKYNLNYKELAAYNDIKDYDKIKEGVTLQLPKPQKNTYTTDWSEKKSTKLKGNNPYESVKGDLITGKQYFELTGQLPSNKAYLNSNELFHRSVVSPKPQNAVEKRMSNYLAPTVYKEGIGKSSSEKISKVILGVKDYDKKEYEKFLRGEESLLTQGENAKTPQELIASQASFNLYTGKPQWSGIDKDKLSEKYFNGKKIPDVYLPSNDVPTKGNKNQLYLKTNPFYKTEDLPTVEVMNSLYKYKNPDKTKLIELNKKLDYSKEHLNLYNDVTPSIFTKEGRELNKIKSNIDQLNLDIDTEKSNLQASKKNIQNTFGIKDNSINRIIASNYNLGNYSKFLSPDKKYISTYDKWDLDMSGGTKDQSSILGIRTGRPFEIYEREQTTPEQLEQFKIDTYLPTEEFKNGGQLNDMKRQKYNVGGFMQAAAPFVGMIPGVGMIAAPAMSLAGGLVSQHEANKELEAANAATNKKNYLQQSMHNEANNYGFMKNGGPIKGGKNPSYDQYVAMKKWWDSMTEEQKASIHQKMEYPSERSIIQKGDKLYNAAKAIPEIDVVQSKMLPKSKNNIAQKGSNKNLFGDKDPLWENLLEIADPTGISSWDDVGRAWTDGKFNYKDVLEPVGAIPFLGKVPKLLGMAGKTFSGLTKAEKIVKGVKGGNVANDADDVYQDNIKYEFEDGGQLTHFEGPSHEQGGIQIPVMGAEVEGGETMNQDNNYVNSDHLGYDKDGYPTMNPKSVKTTFADASKKIENRYKNKNSFEQIAGEKLSQAMINSDNEKVRPKEPQQSMGQQQFTWGGTMRRPPLNQNAMNALGQIPNYQSYNGIQSYIGNRSDFSTVTPSMPWEGTGSTISNGFGSSPANLPWKNTGTPINNGTGSSTSGTRPPGIFSRMKESTSQYTMGDKMNLIGAGIGMASQIPALIARPERAQMRTYNPIVDRTKYNASPELQALEAGRQGYSQSVRDTTANSSTANARMLAGLSNMNQSASNILANKQQQDYQRSNLANQIINQGRQYNAQEAARIDDINAQNRAANLYSKQQSSLNMGQQLAGTGQYFNELASQQTQFALLQDMYSEYGMSGENFADFLRRIKMGESAVQYKQN